MDGASDAAGDKDGLLLLLLLLMGKGRGRIKDAGKAEEHGA